MIEHNTFEEFYNEFKDWSKKDILKRVYDLINETNKWTDVYLDTMNNQQQEIERLNNIINELEKWLNYETDMCDVSPYSLEYSDYTDVLNKLKELKEKKYV